MQLGDFHLTLINGGDFRLDGGAMHGVVPKTLWSRLVSCDADNRCQYATNCLYVERRVAGGTTRLLVETGNGDKFPERERAMYGIDHDESAPRRLRALGIDPAGIDHVVMTHLHFDHAGGATERDGERVRPVFTRARHVVQRQEWHDATHPHERNRASYLRENLAPLADAGLLELVDGEREIAPGVRVLPTPGHTRGHQSLLLDDGAGTKLLFLGDVVPTALHVRLPWIMAYDLDVVATLESKRAILGRALDERWILVFGHERDTVAGRLTVDAKGQFSIGEVVPLPRA